MLDVTVCILSFNRAAYLREALASVLAQTKAPQDIAIFDNGSQGEVLEAVKGYLEKGVRWVGSEVTMSAIWNFKRAVADTKSKYVLVMHDDDRLCRDFLEKQIEFLEENHSVVAVACNGYLIDEIFLFKKGKNFIRFQNKKKVISLRKILKNYNNLFKNNVDIIKEISVNLKKSLQDLGYKV